MYSQDGIMSLAKAGRNGDTELAHLMVGEVVLPPGTLTGNKRLKNAVEKSLAKTDTSLSDVTVGGDTVSINPYTGLPEFGFLSKLWKKVKKVIDPVAQVARFIPGPWQAPANIYIKGKAAINIAKGDDSTSDYLSLFTGEKVLGGDGDLEKFGKVGFDFGGGDWNFETLKEGIGSLFGGGTQDTTQEYIDEFGNKITQSEFDNITNVAEKSMYKPVESGNFLGNFFSGDPNYDPTTGSGQSRFGMIEDYIKGLGGGAVGEIIGGIGSLVDKSGLDPALLALAKYYGDATEKALEKQTGGMRDIRDSIRPDFAYNTSDGYETYGLGGFNLGFSNGGFAANNDIAVDVSEDPYVARTLNRLQRVFVYGYENITPQDVMDLKNMNEESFKMSPTQQAVLNVINKNTKGMQYNQGGSVLDMRDGGESMGPGTGTSDDIPAMLSDGEFVMTAKANKGAGSVGLKQGKDGIMELSPNMEPDRQRGAKNMMTLMRYFEGLA
tara:strand:- start:8516 stop:9997 length:1482 start_codon:yes stop_codon:yes gene_type:complete